MRDTLAPLMSSKSDEWSTPQDLFDTLDAEFHFRTDAAATAENTKCKEWYGPGSPQAEDALGIVWYGPVWLNPPYSMCKEFVAAAWENWQLVGTTVVMLIPARTDTRWFHQYIWDRERHAPQPGIEVRFLKGRLKFGDSTNSAPFPSMIVIFR